MAKNRNPQNRRVTIKHGWHEYTGNVISSINYGTDTEPDWYIEFYEVDIGYMYWKQSIDGGKLLHLDPPTYIP